MNTNSNNREEKTVYKKPNLVTYGSLVEITKSIVNGSGNNDQAKGNDKTGL